LRSGLTFYENFTFGEINVLLWHFSEFGLGGIITFDPIGFWDPTLRIGVRCQLPKGLLIRIGYNFFSESNSWSPFGLSIGYSF
jgi:hypothetical protein